MIKSIYLSKEEAEEEEEE
ncbi:hypothetical protein CGLO_11050 [Colletotrichum gloeosporioides Cg-14]|uniref:Uncharacterized protein n=1 Tax=Colletotrichum gloeosporioides (strain Cg-14) TaxID=1237896 RepID=T0LMY5_COLGC|nr:hypothetical protein CGLO_11050 [Colletotrichum gloeosporioides Cg-14]